MPPRPLQPMLALVLVGTGTWLVLSPLLIAELLHRPHATGPQMINLRATWGGTVIGLGAFAAWLPAMKPWKRAGLGLLLWSMAGIGLARTAGFMIDGKPDGLQWVWLTAEIAIVAACAIGLRKMEAFSGKS